MVGEVGLGLVWSCRRAAGVREAGGGSHQKHNKSRVSTPPTCPPPGGSQALRDRRSRRSVARNADESPQTLEFMSRVGELSDVREESCSLGSLTDFPLAGGQGEGWIPSLVVPSASEGCEGIAPRRVGSYTQHHPWRC